ncbi:MAG: hypothetical protein EBQ92_00910 [Proteobacteria bacterium]|nr:hypothetical protein [Pseudomonadota bacterium]
MGVRFSGLVSVPGVWVDLSGDWYSGKPGSVFERFGMPFCGLRAFQVAGVNVMVVRYTQGRAELQEPSVPAWWVEDCRYDGVDPFRSRRGPFATPEEAQLAGEAWVVELSSEALGHGVHGVDDVCEDEDTVRMRRWGQMEVGAEIDWLTARWAFDKGLPVLVPGNRRPDDSYPREDYVPATREHIESSLQGFIDRELCPDWIPYVKGAASTQPED